MHAAAQLFSRAREADPVKVFAFIQRMSGYTGEQLLFTDESAKDDTTEGRGNGWAAVGMRTLGTTLFVRGKRYSLLPVIGRGGLLGYKIIEGSFNGPEFLDFVKNVLIPCMGKYPDPRSVVVMDNCRIHHIAAVREAIEGAGGRLEFLPPYSPRLNPIENAFNKAKSWLRRNRDVIADMDAFTAVEWALLSITPDTCRGWYAKSCPYYDR